MRKLLLVATLAALPLQAHAQAYPAHAVRLIVSQSAGSSTDIQGRLVAEKLSAAWGEQMYVENKPGANGIIGMREVAKAKPDGYTLGTAAPSAMTYNQYIYSNLPYRPAEDFVPVTQLSTLTFALVAHPSFPPNTVAELVALAKQKPDEITYSTPGIGNLAHLGVELFAAEAGIKLRHIPNKGDAGMIMDLMSGNTNFTISTLPSLLPHVQAGKLKLIAVAGPTRSPLFPSTPTIAEAGYPRVLVQGWVGVVAPAGTPPAIVSKLQSDIARELKKPEVVEAFAKQGSDPVGSTPEAYAAFLQEESAKWKRVIDVSGIRLNQ
jgi:tripartite-type tricarboxylate transporter receptor subunit TctC